MVYSPQYWQFNRVVKSHLSVYCVLATCVVWQLSEDLVFPKSWMWRTTNMERCRGRFTAVHEESLSYMQGVKGISCIWHLNEDLRQRYGLEDEVSGALKERLDRAKERKEQAKRPLKDAMVRFILSSEYLTCSINYSVPLLEVWSYCTQDRNYRQAICDVLWHAGIGISPELKTLESPWCHCMLYRGASWAPWLTSYHEMLPTTNSAHRFNVIGNMFGIVQGWWLPGGRHVDR